MEKYQLTGASTTAHAKSHIHTNTVTAIMGSTEQPHHAHEASKLQHIQATQTKVACLWTTIERHQSDNTTIPRDTTSAKRTRAERIRSPPHTHHSWLTLDCLIYHRPWVSHLFANIAVEIPTHQYTTTTG